MKVQSDVVSLEPIRSRFKRAHRAMRRAFRECWPGKRVSITVCQWFNSPIQDYLITIAVDRRGRQVDVAPTVTLAGEMAEAIKQAAEHRVNRTWENVCTVRPYEPQVGGLYCWCHHCFDEPECPRVLECWAWGSSDDDDENDDCDERDEWLDMWEFYPGGLLTSPDWDCEDD